MIWPHSTHATIQRLSAESTRQAAALAYQGWVVAAVVYPRRTDLVEAVEAESFIGCLLSWSQAIT